MIPDVTDESIPDGQDAVSPGPEHAGGPDPADPGADRTTPSRRGPMTMTDYERAMTERSQHARARGLAAPYIPGGEDPDPEATAREERPYLRLLVLMIAGIIIGAFALSIIGLIVLGNAAPA